MDQLVSVDNGSGEHPAHVSVRAAEPDLLAKFKERTPDADDEFMEAHPPFFWRAEISSTRVDSHYTHMDKTTLRNYAEDAAAGVPFMNSHRTGGLFKGSAELPMGRSLDAKFHAGQRTGDPHTEASFYTLAGLRLGEVSTDDFIAGVRAGIVKDVSVGFMGGRFVCDLCGEDVMRSDSCLHMPGMSYEVESTDGGKKRVDTVTATAAIFDARLGEVSAVFKGSTPGAMITKAHRLAEARQLTPQAITVLEDRYRILLPGGLRTYTLTTNGTQAWTTGANGITVTATGGDRTATSDEVKDGGDMGDKAGTEAPGNERLLQSTLDSIRAAMGLADSEDVVERVRVLATDLKEAKAEAERLRPLADAGKAYRDDLVAQVITEGKRAFGETFNEEQQKALFETAPIETLKTTRDAYKSAADKLFPAQRVTAEDDGEGEREEDRPARRPARSRRAFAA